MATVLDRLRHVLKAGAVVGLAVGVTRWIKGRSQPAVTGTARWQALTEPEPADNEPAPADTERARADTAPADTEPADTAPADTEPTSGARWVEPVDGACPATHPVKGNAGSGIFHVPGGASYDRTIPERCYASPADAEADGFRAARR